MTQAISIDRRHMLLGAGATMVAALAASTRPAPAAASPLPDLIAAHRRAYEAFGAAIHVEEAASNAYRETNPQREIVIPLSIGGAVSLYVPRLWDDRDSLAECQKRIDRAYEKAWLAMPSAAVVGNVTGTLRKAKADDLRTMRRLWKEEQARQEASGLLPATRAREAASDAEREAGLAIMAYPCLTLAEIRMRAEYITDEDQGSSGACLMEAIGNDLGNRLLLALLFASLEEEGGEV